MEKENKLGFKYLASIDVNDKVDTKDNGKTKLKYLSWAWAWNEFKKVYPDAQYKIIKYGENKQPFFYDSDLGYMVSTEVTADGLTYEMWLPVMDHNNNAMKDSEYEIQYKYSTQIVKKASMMDINKNIMRCLVKNLAMFGLGLYIYAGEDIPELPEGEARASDEELQHLYDLAEKLTIDKTEMEKILTEETGKKSSLLLTSAEVEKVINRLLDEIAIF